MKRFPSILVAAVSAFLAVSAVSAVSADKKDVPPAVAAEDAAKTLSRIEKGLKNTKSLRADFVQTNKISLFDKDMVLKGEVAIDYPDGFKWTVLSPVKTIVEMDAGKATIWDEATGETKTFSRGDNPMMDMMWRQLGAWFMGRYDELSKDYDISVVDASETAPKLLFKPKNKLIAKVVESVELSFEEKDGAIFLSKVAMREKSGDSTTVEFKNVVVSTKKTPDK